MSSPITGLDYPELFASKRGIQLLETKGITQLEAFVRNPDGDAYDRLLVAELLHRHNQPYPLDTTGMAHLHAKAISQARIHNPWGLPGEPLEFGETLLALGDPTEVALYPLLQNQMPLRYIGSEEPTLAKMYNYRVADLAAGLLAVCKGLRFINARDPAVRDQWIKGNLVAP
jgi:hypothetical protein